MPLDGRVEAADEVHQRGLAGAGGAHDGDVLVVLDAQVDAAQGLHLLLGAHVVGAPQIFDDDDVAVRHRRGLRCVIGDDAVQSHTHKSSAFCVRVQVVRVLSVQAVRAFVMRRPPRTLLGPPKLLSLGDLPIRLPRGLSLPRPCLLVPANFQVLVYRFHGVALDQRAVLEGAQSLVGAGHDLVAFLQTGEHLDVGGAGDAGGDGNELGAELSVRILVDDEDALLPGAGLEPGAGVEAASTLPEVAGASGECMVSAWMGSGARSCLCAPW